MATLRIEFKNNKFVSHNGVNVIKMTDTHIEANDWIGNVDENGNIYFISINYYKGERHQLKFKIANGWVKKILKIGNGPSKVLRSYKMDEWPINGIIGLSAGYVDTRTTYFRTADFQQFLDEHGITAVHCEPACGLYRLKQRDYDGSKVYLESIETDGRIELLSERGVQADYKLFVVDRIVEVTDATWVVKTILKCGKLNNRILYTLDDPRQIVGLPKFD